MTAPGQSRSAADAEREADAACKKAHAARAAAFERMHIKARAIADRLTDDAVAEAQALCPAYVVQRTEWQAADTAYHEAFTRWLAAFTEWTRLDEARS